MKYINKKQEHIIGRHLCRHTHKYDTKRHKYDTRQHLCQHIHY